MKQERGSGFQKLKLGSMLYSGNELEKNKWSGLSTFECCVSFVGLVKLVMNSW